MPIRAFCGASGVAAGLLTQQRGEGVLRYEVLG